MERDKHPRDRKPLRQPRTADTFKLRFSLLRTIRNNGAAFGYTCRLVLHGGSFVSRAQRSVERSAMMRHASLRLRSRCVASGTRDSNGRILITDSLVKQPTSFPRPHCCVRALSLCFTHPPIKGVGGAPRNVGVLGGAPVGVHVTRHARRLARRLASHDAGRTPPGAPPWRFWAPGSRASLPVVHLGWCLGRRFSHSELLASRS